MYIAFAKYTVFWQGRVFLIVLYLTTIIALASVGSALAVMAYLWQTMGFTPIVWALLVFDALIIWWYRADPKRIVKHKENKIKWMSDKASSPVF